MTPPELQHAFLARLQHLRPDPIRSLVSLTTATPTAPSYGFVLADIHLRPVYTNNAADSVLDYLITRESTKWESAAQARLRVILQITEYSVDSLPPVVFTSGRRRYVCRSFRFDLGESTAHSPLVALLMEREPQAHASVLEASRRFHLSPRECETVLYLSRGLTTKEIAQHMSVSPNTVKQFVRITMSKMGVTTRSGILGKLLLVS